MPTNAQTALTAAATVYSGGRGHTTPASVKLLAETFKNWLDHQDAQEPPEPEQRDTTLDAMVERSEPTAEPELHRDYREEPIYRARPIGFAPLGDGSFRVPLPRSAVTGRYKSDTA